MLADPYEHDEKERSMRLTARLFQRIGIALIAGALLAVVPATAGWTASTRASHADSMAVTQARVANHDIAGKSLLDIPFQAYDDCSPTFWCTYNTTHGGSFCLSSPGNVSNWGNYGCRNEDESFANRTNGGVRLYYSPNYKGPWACVNRGWYSNNLNKDVYLFYNGSGTGHLREIWKNVASSSVGSRCTNPLPEDG
jgi:hypothetical protein